MRRKKRNRRTKRNGKGDTSHHRFVCRRKARAASISRHHLLPRCRGGSNLRINLIRIKRARHDSWHVLFGVLDITEATECLRLLAQIEHARWNGSQQNKHRVAEHVRALSNLCTLKPSHFTDPSSAMLSVSSIAKVVQEHSGLPAKAMFAMVDEIVCLRDWRSLFGQRKPQAAFALLQRLLCFKGIAYREQLLAESESRQRANLRYKRASTRSVRRQWQRQILNDVRHSYAV